MKYLTLFYLIAIGNLMHAMTVYASLHGWLDIGSERSNGMQLLLYVFVTAPIVCITTAAFFVLAKKSICTSHFWTISAIELLIPIFSIQTGVTFYHFDKARLLIALSVLIALSYYYVKEKQKRIDDNIEGSEAKAVPQKTSSSKILSD